MDNKYNFSFEEVNKLLNDFSEFNDIKGAYLYYKELNKFIEENKLKEVDFVVYQKYNNYLAKLKFIALNFFDNWSEIIELIKNHFEVIYEIKYFNVWDKFKVNLITMTDWLERDKIKEELKKALLECDRIIINKNKYPNKNILLSVADWLKDYNSNLGLKDIDKLKRAQYLINGENIKNLDDKDRNKVRILFNFYEKIKIPSSSFRGNEDDVPMIINGQPIIFTEGEAEEISQDILNVIRSIKTEEKTASESYDKPLAPEQEKKVKELQDIAAQFPEGSLERKAVEEEIKKLVT